MKYIVVIGSVISGIGKGITSSSIGILFQSMGYTVTMIKVDPYLNCDSGTMGPAQHGECFVLSDGGECDLDLGNYERFLDIELTRDHNITTGKIYQRVINKERNGDYLGATVQVVPHITDEIIAHISRVSRLPVNGETPDICIIEVGGTIGDIEVLPFVEAIQQMRTMTESEGQDQFCFVCVSLAINNPELKTKPIQHSIATLRSRGIFPDILVVRSSELLTDEVKHKLHRLCQITPTNIISNPNVSTIYHVPAIFNNQQICNRIGSKLGLEFDSTNLPVPYTDILNYYNNLPSPLEIRPKRIGIVGKYIGQADTYLSLVRAIEHASFHLNMSTKIIWIDSENCNELEISRCHALIIPGGFGSRGIQGKLQVAEYARKSKTPLLGICLGMQVMVVDSLKQYGVNASSREWADDNSGIDYAIDILPDQTGIKGGTMRLGNYTTILTNNRIRDLYGSDIIVERHRHRYEVNNKYLSDIEASGLSIVGKGMSSPLLLSSTENSSVKSTEYPVVKSMNGYLVTDAERSHLLNLSNLVEIVQQEDHPFYIGCQFHPELKSRHKRPHPLFLGLLRACIK